MSKPQILVIDDDNVSRTLICKVLSDLAEVVSASGGAEGLAFLQSKRPHLIVLDMVMPIMDGFAVMAEIKQSPRLKEIPVIAVTASRDETVESAVLEAGAVDFVHKPVNPTSLRARVSSHLALAKQRIKLQERVTELVEEAKPLQYAANYDSLSGLLNRHRMADYLDAEIAIVKRGQRSSCVVMFDVDKFKQINDVYGHAAGDVVIENVGKMVKKRLRASDKSFRFGGDEFVLLLSETSLDQANIVATHICQMMATTAFGDMPIGQVTGSFGVTQISERDEDYRDVLARADKGMYLSKKLGRNHVEIVPLEHEDS